MWNILSRTKKHVHSEVNLEVCPERAMIRWNKQQAKNEAVDGVTFDESEQELIHARTT
jgi:hypothetical protein